MHYARSASFKSDFSEVTDEPPESATNNGYGGTVGRQAISYREGKTALFLITKTDECRGDLIATYSRKILSHLPAFH